MPGVSAGAETDAAGRDLERQGRPDGRRNVDFNRAYAPFCAYGKGGSCPIPRGENHVAVVNPAGERAFRDGARDAAAD